jgi:hypothetical protein
MVDVEVSLRRIRLVLRAWSDDPAVQPLDPDIGITDDLPRVELVVVVVAIGVASAQVPGQVLERIAARNGDHVFHPRRAVRHEIVGIVPGRDAIRAPPFDAGRIRRTEGIHEVDVPLGIDVVDEHVRVRVAPEEHAHALPRPVHAPFLPVDPDVDLESRGLPDRLGRDRRDGIGRRRPEEGGAGQEECEERVSPTVRVHGSFFTSSGLSGSIWYAQSMVIEVEPRVITSNLA